MYFKVFCRKLTVQVFILAYNKKNMTYKWAVAMVQWIKLSEILGPKPALALSFKETKFLSCSLERLHIVGSFSDREVASSASRLPRLEFQIMCLEGSDIHVSFIAPSSGGSPGAV